MKCLVFGGTQLKDYHGRWWVSRQPMGASFGLRRSWRINHDPFLEIF
jgi:hypothetical protein